MPHDVFVLDDHAPEDSAMLQALYSRSPASVVTHLEKLKAAGSGNFMDQYYVGYGHASIGDCGSTTCFIEQVSMLVAKAIQDNPLYSGQEASTRYLDYARQAVIDPYAQAASTAVQNRWKEIYNDTRSKLLRGLKAHKPFDPATYKNERVWENTLSARAFDIARSLLPVGTTTLLSWTTSLRAARDNLRRLKHHPLEEVRAVAQSLHAALAKKYPHSFRLEDMDTQTETPRDSYESMHALDSHYQTPEAVLARFALSDTESATLAAGGLIARRELLDLEALRRCEGAALAQRPRGAAPERRLESYGFYSFLFLLDYGSFRDIQRHRNGVCPLPLLDARYGFHPWYLEQFEALLDTADFKALQDSIAQQLAAVAALPLQGIATTPQQNQYLLPMGLRALIHLAYTVPQTLYVGELRSGKTVHGSLRPVAQAMLNVLASDLPGIALYGDLDPDDWTAKRGEQTITRKAG